MSTAAAISMVEVAAFWRRARRVYPIYLALDQQCGFGLGPCRQLESPIDRSDLQSTEAVENWLQQMDTKIEVHQLRQLLQTSHIADEGGLQALIGRQLDRPVKDNLVRDKVDYLLVQYYAHCAPHDAHQSSIDHDHVSQVLQPVVGDVSPLVPGFCADLDRILAELHACKSLGDLLAAKIIDRARSMKDAAGAEYFKPSVLVAYARFNFLLRRGFFRLMHADLHAIRFAVHQMETRGQHSCDCSSAGLGEDESFAKLREICHDWKKPFRAAYSVGQTFAQLVSIRAAVEAAMSRPLPVPEPVIPKAAAPDVSVAVASRPAVAPPAPQPAPPQQVPAPVAQMSPAEPRAAEISAQENCIAQIHEVLSKLQVKGAAACNFSLGSTKLVLASWEVVAFIRPSVAGSLTLQRAIAARVLLIQATEARKRGESVDFAGAKAQAHTEAAHLQEEIAAAKDRKDIDTAVNLSATAKRLLALVEQAEKTK